MTEGLKRQTPSTGTGQSAWRFAVRYRAGFTDAEAEGLKADIQDLGIAGVAQVSVASVYYVSGALSDSELKRLGQELLADPITQEVEVQPLTLTLSRKGRGDDSTSTIEVIYRPGVRDPVEDSLKKGAEDLGISGIAWVRTAKAYTLTGPLTSDGMSRICEKLLVNATIQERVTPENLKALLRPSQVQAVAIETVHLLAASDTVLQRVSVDHQLSLNLEEMRTIQSYFKGQGREPALIELETLAQTWSEHCKHKTLRGKIVYTEELSGQTTKRTIDNLLESTIMRATQELNKPWCVSVFVDNSGVISFDEAYNVCFKVETHNHPCALEPFGGAATGIGGVIRDILGTGLSAKPVASTDVFCFAPPDLASEEVPPGMLHPKRIIKGVVRGVKDYGNKMGIPTVNGAVCFDERFVGNPLVYCGNVGLLPKGKEKKKVSPGMAVVLAGGRTGRDGIHGATFSSIGLTCESEVISQTAVQIGDPITEKKLSDALLIARDKGLFEAVTDCGAGGLSSAVGEMGASCGARVHLERVPLKYAGLTPTEIWISESQERMVLAVLPEALEKLLALFHWHGVPAAAIGEFTNTGKLELLFQGNAVGTLSMEFLHEGVAQVLRPGRWVAPSCAEPGLPPETDLTGELLKLLAWWDTCSKEWIIRQYDHEVQGGSVIKPLAGVSGSAPSDAAVVRPLLSSDRGIILSNGINFRYGDLDPYWMAAAAIDEAIRQIIAVGGTLDQVALLDNFCWGDPTRPEVLGSLVRSALGCYDAARAFGTPFISGKDSLHNAYRFGEKTIQIPGTLLISAIGVMPDAGKALSMDAKRAGNALYLVGLTHKEMGGSSYYALKGVSGGQVPRVDLKKAPDLFKAVSKAIAQNLVASAHDCSEGGLAVAAAEMAFAGALGLTIDLQKVPQAAQADRDEFLLFSESPSRFLLEVAPEKEKSFLETLQGFPVDRIGQFEFGGTFRVMGLSGKPVVETTVGALQESWAAPFKGW